MRVDICIYCGQGCLVNQEGGQSGWDWSATKEGEAFHTVAIIFRYGELTPKACWALKGLCTYEVIPLG